MSVMSFWLTLDIRNANVVRIDSGLVRSCLQRPLLNEQEQTKTQPLQGLQWKTGKATFTFYHHTVI